MEREKKDIKVSVVMAVFNSEKYLRDTLDSVRAQSLREIEMICVDDGSTDASLAILKEYADLDDRFVILEQTENSDGAGKARNLGLSHARGEYLSVLDSDDFFEPDMLQKAYDKAVKTQADIVLYDGYEFDEKLGVNRDSVDILRKKYLPKEKDVFSPKENKDFLFQMSIGTAWCTLMRKDFIMGQGLRFQSFHHADDLGFVYAAFACADRIAVLKERLIHYRRNNSGSQRENIAKCPTSGCEALLQLKNELTDRGVYETFKVSFVQFVITYVVFYLDAVKQYAAFAELYQKFKARYYALLDVDAISDEQFSMPFGAIFRNALRDLTAGEFCYHRLYGLPPFDGRGGQGLERENAKER